MAFSGNFMCTSFKVELMKGVHNFTTGTGNTFKLALYDNSASFTAATTAYTATNEVAASGSYSAGGQLSAFWTLAVQRRPPVVRSPSSSQPMTPPAPSSALPNRR